MLPYSQQSLSEEDIHAVIEALRSPILTGGDGVEAFEEALAEYTQTAHAVVFSSGTAALHAAYTILGVGEGDEVITTPLSFAATANAALYVGAVPKFVDIRYDGNINETLIEGAITDKTKAIVAVDYGGTPCNMQEINAIAKKHHLSVIEDASHALGSRLDDQSVGSWADVTVFSFHPVKPITTFEGGALVVSDAALSNAAKHFRSHGIVKKQFWNQDMISLGYNYRLSDVACALGKSQLKRLDHFIQKRNEIAAIYDEAFKTNPYFLPIPIQTNRYSARHLYPVLLDRRFWCPKEEIFSELQARGLGVQVHYKPIYRHSYYQKHYPTKPLQTAEDFYRAELSIPCHQNMDEADARKVIRDLNEVFKAYETAPSCS